MREREIKAFREFSNQVPSSRQLRTRNLHSNQAEVNGPPTMAPLPVDQEGMKRMTPPVNIMAPQRNIAVPPLERNVSVSHIPPS